jgi:hypothetical protein
VVDFDYRADSRLRASQDTDPAVEAYRPARTSFGDQRMVGLCLARVIRPEGH